MRRGGVEVACGEAPEAAVPECGVAFAVDEVFECVAECGDGGGELGFEAEVEEGVVEGAAHEEFEGEVVGAFGGFAGVGELGFVPVCLRVG